MRYLKTTGFIIAVISLFLLAACGTSPDGTWIIIPPSDGSAVSISITQSLSMLIGETKTLNVTKQNTDDFTVSVSPASGSGCAKSGNSAVACTPTAAGTYTVTVTATADTSKKSSATVTVTENNDTFTLQVEKFGEGIITGDGINCGATCENTYQEGATVTLTAITGSGWEFRSWAGCDSVNGAFCTVTLNADKTVLPTFGRDTLIYTPETVSLGESAMSALINKDGTKYYFNSPASQIGALKPGDVMVSAVGEGLLRRVLSVETVGGQFVVETADASLEDVIKYGTLSWSGQLTEDDVLDVIPLASGVRISKKPVDMSGVLRTGDVKTAANAKLPLSRDIEILFCIEKVTETVVICDEWAQAAGSQEEIGKAVGSFEFSAEAVFNVDFAFGWPPVDEVELDFILGTKDELSLKISKSFSGNAKLQFVRVPFAPIPIGPVTFRPEFVLTLGIEGSANGEVSATISTSLDATTGMHYKKGEGWKPIDSFNTEPPSFEPALSAATSVKGYIRAEFNIKIAEIAGPSVRADVYLKLQAKGKVSPSGVDLNAGLYWGTTGYIGGKVEIISWTLAEYYAELWSKEWTLWEQKLFDDDPPSMPTGLKVTPVSPRQTNVSWNEAPDAAGYNIYRGIMSATALVDSVTTLSFVDKGLLPLVTYCYQVSAINASGDESARSERVCSSTWPALDVETPTVPQNLTAAAVSPTQINLKWSESTDNLGVVGYGIFRNSVEYPIKSVTLLSFSDTGLIASTQYCYQVAAYDAAGNASEKSAQVCATTSAESATQKLDDFLGSYRGSYYANQGHTGVTLKVYVNENNEYVADFDFYALPDNPGVPTGKYLCSVSYDGITDTYLVKGEEWVNHPPSYVFVDFHGTLNGDIFSGNTFSVTRQENATNPYAGEMVFVQGGTFTMGCTPEQGSDCLSNEYPAHQVTLSDFYIGKYEVTQAQWEAVMGNNPSSIKGDNLPVNMVSWNDVQEFITKLNAMTGKSYRLPTEAEWEYAARGGKQSRGYKYSGSNNIEEVAWHPYNSDRQPHPVGTKSANELGIYDMSGNVSEWVSDWFGSYGSAPQTNPAGPISGSSRTHRGGSISGTYAYDSFYLSFARVSARYFTDTTAVSGQGFRLAITSNPATDPFTGKYDIYDLGISWNDAKAYCENFGGHLATITSREENAFLYDYMLNQGYENAYFGLYKDNNNNWNWVTGEKTTFINWADGEPNNEGGSELYGMFYWKYRDGRWNDGGPRTTSASSNNTPFICEFE